MEKPVLLNRAVIYARYVAERAEMGEIVKQEERCKEYIEANGYEFAGSYIDEGATGSHMNRPALDQLRADAAAGKFDRIVVFDLSRIARNRLLLERFIYEMQAQVIFINSVKELIKR